MSQQAKFDVNTPLLKTIYPYGVKIPDQYEAVRVGPVNDGELFMGITTGPYTADLVMTCNSLSGISVLHHGIRLVVRKKAEYQRSENVWPSVSDWLNNIRPDDAGQKFKKSFNAGRKMIFVFRGDDVFIGAEKWVSAFYAEVTMEVKCGPLISFAPVTDVPSLILKDSNLDVFFLHSADPVLTHVQSRALIGTSTILNAELVYVNNFMSREELLKAGVPVEVAPAYDPKLPNCIIVDLDGTLADSSHRDPLNSSGDEILRDGVISHVREICYDAIRKGEHIMFVTGRGGKSGEYGPTRQWIWQRTMIETDASTLLTRQIGDNRDDAVVKLELYEKHIRGKFNVSLVLDDRPRVIRMWHSLGLPVLANKAYVQGEF